MTNTKTQISAQRPTRSQRMRGEAAAMPEPSFDGRGSLPLQTMLRRSAGVGLDPGDQSERAGMAEEVRAPRAIELVHDPRAVRLDRAHAEVEPGGGLLVRVARGEQPQHIPLARRQRTARRRGSRLRRL